MNDLEQHLGYWIKRSYLLSAQFMEAHLQAFGLGRSQWQLMYHLMHDGPTSQRQLQKKLSIESATLTAIVASLTRKGWVAQSPDPSDKRSKQIDLTPAGERLWNSLPDPLATVHATMLQNISLQDVEHAKRLLAHIVKNLEESKGISS